MGRWLEQSYALWAKTRAMGRVRFVLFFGVLGFGVGMMLLSAVYQALFYRYPFLQALAHQPLNFLLAGAAWGWFMWALVDYVYEQHVARQNAKAQTYGVAE